MRRSSDLVRQRFPALSVLTERAHLASVGFDIEVQRVELALQLPVRSGRRGCGLEGLLGRFGYCLDGRADLLRQGVQALGSVEGGFPGGPAMGGADAAVEGK